MAEANEHQIGILENFLNHRQPHQYTHLKKKKTSIIVNYFCLPVSKFDLLKTERCFFNLF